MRSVVHNVCLAFRTVVIVFVVLGASMAFGGQIVQDTDLVRAEVDLVWEGIPHSPRGYLPLVVTLTNRTDGVGRWRVKSAYRSGEPTVEFTQALTVEAGQTRRFDLLIPFRSQNYGNLSVTLNGTGFRESWERFFTIFRSGDPFFGGLSEDLYAEVGFRLEQWSDQSGRHGGHGGMSFAAVDPGAYPDDWRAYLAFDCLWFSEVAWAGLPKGDRGAIVDWVFAGGRLRLLTQRSATAAFPSLPEGEVARPLGRGVIEVFSGDLETEGAWIDGALADPRNRSYAQQARYFATNYRVPVRLAVETSNASTGRQLWEGEAGFRGTVDPPKVNPTLIIIAVITFGVLVGPVNFFLLAKGRRRWRVFLTIPAFSLAFSLLLFLGIILADGFGGEGYLSRLVVINSSRQTRLLVQQDISRTGLLFDQSFALPADVDYTQVGVFLGVGALKTDVQGLKRTGLSGYDGAYFESRQMQLNELVRVERTRERVLVTLSDAGPPSLRANLQAGLGRVYYIDEAAQVWTLASLGVGREATMTAASLRDFSGWWRGAVARSGMTSEGLPSAPLAGWFYAEGQPLPETFPEPFDSVHWQDFQTLYTGPVAVAP